MSAKAQTPGHPRNRKFFVAVLASVGMLACLVFPQTAQAYLDPGVGSYVFQVTIAAVLAGLATLRVSWSRVKAYFRRCATRRPEDDRHRH